MKIWYDYYNNIGVVIATKWCHYLFHLQVQKIQISQQEQKNRIMYLTGGIDWCVSCYSQYSNCWPLLWQWIIDVLPTHNEQSCPLCVSCQVPCNKGKSIGDKFGNSHGNCWLIHHWYLTDTQLTIHRYIADSHYRCYLNRLSVDMLTNTLRQENATQPIFQSTLNWHSGRYVDRQSTKISVDTSIHTPCKIHDL